MSEAERIAHFGVWRWELATGRVRWSDELHRIYGLEPGEFVGTVDGFLAYLHPDDRDRVWAAIDHAMQRLEPFVFEERIVRADGGQRVLLSQGHVLAGIDGVATAVVGVCHDVTERAEAERALGHSERRMRAIIDHTPSIVAVKSLDGHYLMTNAETSRVLGMAPEEIIGRPCSELFPDITDQLRAADRRASAEGEIVYDEARLTRDGEPRTFATVTFMLPDAAGLPVETCTIATDVTERRERRECQQRIASAIDEDRMLVFAQPVVDLRTGAADWRELLVRMMAPRPGGELLQPADFIPAAERLGSIQLIDIWMVRQALALPVTPAPVVNLSAVTLSDPAARHEIVGLLRESPEVAARLTFEITESASPGHLDAARDFARELTDLGCGLALDDFGTGFGSFTYLRVLPLRYLKIDRSFVLDLARSRDDRRVVQSTIAIAREFGLRTIAEGVEDQATLDLLREMGADFVQGYNLGRPAPVVPLGGEAVDV